MKKLLVVFFCCLAVFARSQTITDTVSYKAQVNIDIVSNSTNSITATKLNRILLGVVAAIRTTLETRINKTDTSAMLSNLLRKTDTVQMLSGYVRKGHSLLYIDTAAMHVNLLRKTDTSAMLSNLLRKTDTVQMLSGYVRKGHSLLYIDTAAMHVNLLRKTDTSVMLSNLLRKTDTVQMLSGYVRKGHSLLYIDTAAMHVNLLRKTDTSVMLSNLLRKTDTVQMLSGYVRKGHSLLYIDTAAMHVNLLRKTDTSQMLSSYLRISSAGNFVPYSGASQNVQLGSNSLFTSGLTITGRSDMQALSASNIQVNGSQSSTSVRVGENYAGENSSALQRGLLLLSYTTNGVLPNFGVSLGVFGGNGLGYVRGIGYRRYSGLDSNKLVFANINAAGTTSYYHQLNAPKNVTGSSDGTSSTTNYYFPSPDVNQSTVVFADSAKTIQTVGVTGVNYTEGVFTPTGNGITFSSAKGNYYKLGKWVTVQMQIVVPSTADGSAFQIKGLPFAFKNGQHAPLIMALDSVAIPYFLGGSSSETFLFDLSNAPNASFSDITLSFSFTYLTN